MVDEMLTLDPNPFNKPIDAPNGDTDARNVFASVGYALSAWEHAETELATMFALLMRPTGGRHVPFRAFGGIFSSSSRRELIELAVEAYFAILSTPCDGPTKARGKDLHEEIKKFLRLFGDASRRRDEIAHGVVMSDPITPANQTPVYFVVPAFYASKKIEVLPPFTPSYRLSTKELDRYSRLFELLSSRASQLNADLSGFYSSLPEKARELHP